MMVTGGGDWRWCCQWTVFVGWLAVQSTLPEGFCLLQSICVGRGWCALRRKPVLIRPSVSAPRG